MLSFGTIAIPQEQGTRPAQINILNAETMEAPYPGMGSDGIRLLENVRLQHEDVFMTCDSAHRYSNTNMVHAFGNVHINQGDTLHLYGDHLIYYGNRRYAEVRRNVVLKDRETTLSTESLDFDLENDFGYYPNRGVVINGDNKLESIRGYYYTEEKLFFFKDSVVITNPDYMINSDTLKYNTLTEVVYFLGPTTIIGDETNIYCENGWYNTITDISQFNENARVRNNNQILSADSIYYDNGQGYGKAFKSIEITDTIENIIIRGNYAWFNRNPEQTLITDRALLIQMSENDTLYLHADTLRSWLETVDTTLPEKPDLQMPGKGDSVVIEVQEVNEFEPADDPVPDSTDNQIDHPYLNEKSDNMNELMTGTPENDTVRILVAYYGVRFFSNEMQGSCDSMYYNMRDSIIFMFGEPVVWSDQSQLTAEFMEIHSRDGEPDRIIMKNSAFIISEEEPGSYNQIKGKDILGYFNGGELVKVNVSGNAETLYYPVEDEEIIGINKARSARLIIFLKESKPERIRFLNQPEATLYPLKELSESERILDGFIWLDDLRPLDPCDVFRK